MVLGTRAGAMEAVLLVRRCEEMIASGYRAEASTVVVGKRAMCGGGGVGWVWMGWMVKVYGLLRSSFSQSAGSPGDSGST